MTSSPYRSHKTPHERYNYSAGSQEPMLIQDGYCSPERPSYKGSSKQTPKSILKEYGSPGSKSKKGIFINETLNETRKLSLKSETSDASAIRLSHAAEQARRDQNMRPQSAATSSFEVQLTGSSQKDNGKYRYQSDNKKGLGANWTSQEFNTSITRGNNTEVSDLQKAYTRKQQREREQEIYCEMVRRSEMKQAEENENARRSATYQENKQVLKDFEEKRRSLDTVNSQRSFKSLSSIGYVEEKIQQLEKCLDVYSNRLRDSIIRQRDQLLASHYRKTGNIESGANTGPLRSWENKEGPSRNQEDGNEEGKKLKDQTIKDKRQKISSDNQGQGGKPQSNRQWDELDNELSQLRQESSRLKSKLAVPQESYKSTLKQDEKYMSGNIADKEMELLKTVDQIRAKLYNSICKKSVSERNNQSEKNTTLKSSYKQTKTREPKTEKDIKKKNAGIPSKYQKVREAYGEATLERENACILYQGLSTTYNGFHWNADQSLKIPRNL